MNWVDIGPDIEADAAEWEAEQAALAALREDEERGLNSCDALRVMDGIPLVEEAE